MDFINSDRTLKVGDLVFSSYHKGELLFKIVEIERRFLDQYDLRYDVYKGGQIGDEYNPIVTVVSVADFSMFAKKFRKTTKTLDASYLRRASPEHIQEQIKKLNDALSEFWP